MYLFLFVYLTVLDLSCCLQDLQSSLQHVGVLAEACGIQFFSDRTQAPCIGIAESQPLDHQGGLAFIGFMFGCRCFSQLKVNHAMVTELPDLRVYCSKSSAFTHIFTWVDTCCSTYFSLQRSELKMWLLSQTCQSCSTEERLQTHRKALKASICQWHLSLYTHISLTKANSMG